jgi:hypothetical protein
MHRAFRLVLVVAAIVASTFHGVHAQLKIRLVNDSDPSSLTVLPTGSVAHVSTASAGHVSHVSTGPAPAQPPGEVEAGHPALDEHSDVDTMRRILNSLPEPEADVQAALSAPNLTEAELRSLLRDVWQRRQAMLREYMDGIKTDADFMRTLLERLMVPAAGEPGQAGAADGDDPRVGVLEDLEYHVSKVDNARDFKTVRTLACGTPPPPAHTHTPTLTDHPVSSGLSLPGAPGRCGCSVWVCGRGAVCCL